MQTWWQDKKEWSQNAIRSSAKKGMYAIWFFAIFWNLISYTPFLGDQNILSEIKRNPPAALVFLFPLIGFGLAIAAIRMTMAWRKFGPTPLVMDPFPGSIGGHVGGSIDTALRYATNQKCLVTLACCKSYITGSGKNRRRTEKVLWQNEGYCHQQASARGTEFSFRFSVPHEQPESEPTNQETYILWKISIHADRDGADLKREYIIPVFKTGNQVSSIPAATEDHPLTQSIAEEGVYEVAQIQSTTDGVEVYFPALIRPAPGIGMTVFGALFGGAGLFTGKMGAPIIFPLVFGIVGFGILAGGIFYLAKSLHVRVNTGGVTARRFLFGYPITTRSLDADIIKTVNIESNGSMQSGNKTTVLYKVIARSHANKKVILGERLQRRAEAERLKEMFDMYLGK